MHIMRSVIDSTESIEIDQTRVYLLEIPGRTLDRVAHDRCSPFTWLYTYLFGSAFLQVRLKSSFDLLKLVQEIDRNRTRISF